ncbi:hypothetical protein EI94DRAFT_1752637 [Lactarius quietus]|nr:hypothetical protein EI94DRAFT_1752637 [Lactarius quietus]
MTASLSMFAISLCSAVTSMSVSMFAITLSSALTSVSLLQFMHTTVSMTITLSSAPTSSECHMSVVFFLCGHHVSSFP